MNRTDAGKKLVPRLLDYKKENGIVLAVPRGGIPVAAEVARELNLPLDIILVRKIGHPENKEYAIGAASLDNFLISDREGVTEEYITDELKSIRKTLESMDKTFNTGRPKINIHKKTVILIDDGVATGNTLLAKIRLLKLYKPAGIIVAVPVATKDAVRKLSKESDDVVVLVKPDYFSSVGSFYNLFEQVTDEDVKNILARSSAIRKKAV